MTHYHAFVRTLDARITQEFVCRLKKDAQFALYHEVDGTTLGLVADTFFERPVQDPNYPRTLEIQRCESGCAITRDYRNPDAQ